MMRTTEISELMVKDHIKIVELLHNLEQNLEKPKVDMKRTFNLFIWGLEKHLFIEEKAIFTQIESDDIPEIYHIIAKVIEDHDIIQTNVKNMRKSIKKGRDFDFNEFKEFLINHKNYEDEIVYPIFDLELDETIKEEIVSRINEII